MPSKSQLSKNQVEIYPQTATEVFYQLQPNTTASPNPQTKTEPRTQLRIIRNLDPTLLKVIDDILVIVRAVDDDRDNFIASFDRADISASGDTPEESMRNLCETIAMNFTYFEDNEDKLGLEPRRQLSVLRQYIQK